MRKEGEKCWKSKEKKDNDNVMMQAIQAKQHQQQ